MNRDLDKEKRRASVEDVKAFRIFSMFPPRLSLEKTTDTIPSFLTCVVFSLEAI